MTPEEHDRPTPTEIFQPEPLKTSKRPPPLLTEPPKRTASGQHPAVAAMRKKLNSIVEGQTAYDELDAKIEDATKRLKTPLPPELPKVEIQEGEFDDDTPTEH
jgi:hypothetical protein